MNYFHWALPSALFADLTTIPTKVGVIDAVVFVTLRAAALLREKMTLRHLPGGLLIVAGAVILTWKSGKA